MEVVGDPVVMLDGVSQSVNAALAYSDSGAGQFAISKKGDLAYVPGGIPPEDLRSLVWVDRNGEVFVQPLPGAGQRLQISSAGGVEPVWSRDGSELFYRSLAPQQVMAVSVQAGEQLVVSRARPLFDDPYVRSNSGSMDVARDGRFLMLRQEEEERAEPYDEVRIVLNWTQELERLVAKP